MEATLTADLTILKGFFPTWKLNPNPTNTKSNLLSHEQLNKANSLLQYKPVYSTCKKGYVQLNRVFVTKQFQLLPTFEADRHYLSGNQGHIINNPSYRIYFRFRKPPLRLALQLVEMEFSPNNNWAKTWGVIEGRNEFLVSNPTTVAVGGMSLQCKK